MQNELTYIGPESQGPHYLESGKRPIHSAMFQPVIVQLDSGYVGPAIWARDPEDPQMRFAFLSTGMVAISPAPVCWWHLPVAAPSTEREWFVSEYWDCEEGVHRYSKNGLYFTYVNREPKLLTKGKVIYLLEASLVAAKEAAYQHWVEAGRP
jgi:hypothetical protein